MATSFSFTTEHLAEISTLYQKLGVARRTDAIAKAASLNMQNPKS